MEIRVTKLTGIDLLHKANSFTTGRESHMDLAKAYRYGHSPIRTQLFWIEMRDIPLFCASQLVRSHVGVQWYQRSKRTDRGGEDFREVCDAMAQNMERCCESEDDWSDICCRDIQRVRDFPKRFDRYAPTDLACLINAEAIINMSHKRLCAKASKETTEIWQQVLDELLKVDNELYLFCVPLCVHKGYCSEPKTCGYTKGKVFKEDRELYLKLFENE